MGTFSKKEMDEPPKRICLYIFKPVLLLCCFYFLYLYGRRQILIEVNGLNKSFKLYSSPVHRLQEVFLGKKRHVMHHALQDLSFRVEDGESLGIIGPNGAGKSTLLKILNGVIMKDSGSVKVSGKVTGLLELGTGFNPEMTGLENIYMNGLLIGMEKEYIEQHLDEIISFSELEEFIHEPLKIYSSGMVMRLAFSIAISAKPSCFLVDEALSVGDSHFQQKCMRRIRAFREKGGSIIFVSHDMNAVKMLCDKALLLHNGKMLEYGDPEKVVNSYNFILAEMNDDDNRITVSSSGLGSQSYGSLEATIENVRVYGKDSLSSVITSGERAKLDIHFKAHKKLDNITVGFGIRDRFGQDIYGTNTFHMGKSISCKDVNVYCCSYEFDMNIAPGKYTVNVSLHSDDTHYSNCYHWVDNIEEFEVAGARGPVFIGVVRLVPSVNIHESELIYMRSVDNDQN